MPHKSELGAYIYLAVLGVALPLAMLILSVGVLLGLGLYVALILWLVYEVRSGGNVELIAQLPITLVAIGVFSVIAKFYGAFVGIGICGGVILLLVVIGKIRGANDA